MRRLSLQITLGWGMFAATLALALAPLVEFTVLQVNDVYELGGLRKGRAGGLPRLATLKQQLRAENPNTVVVLAGDFLSPSFIGSLVVNGRALAGRQMIDVANGIIDYAILGNHDLELKWDDLVDRINESNFHWIVSNLYQNSRRNIPGTRRYYVHRFHNAEAEVKIGFMGLTLDSARPTFLAFTDPVVAAAEVSDLLATRADKIISFTHLPLSTDQQIARLVPRVEVILGGHEHDHTRRYAGRERTEIYKADSNALTAWIHRFAYVPQTRELRHRAELRYLDESIPEDPATALKVAYWNNLAREAILKKGFDPEAPIGTLPHEWDGSSKIVRRVSNSLTADLLGAISREAPDADIAFIQAGTIRIDDKIDAGDLAVYDLFRVLPYDWNVVELVVRGDLLTRLLEQGERNRGTGGFLHASGFISTKSFLPTQNYRVATSDFLAGGNETSLAFFRVGEPGIRLVKTHRIIYSALIDYLRATCGPRIAGDL